MSRRTIFNLIGFLGLGIGLYFGKSHGPFSQQAAKLPAWTAEQKATYKRGQPYTSSRYWLTPSETCQGIPKDFRKPPPTGQGPSKTPPSAAGRASDSRRNADVQSAPSYSHLGCGSRVVKISSGCDK